MTAGTLGEVDDTKQEPNRRKASKNESLAMTGLGRLFEGGTIYLNS